MVAACVLTRTVLLVSPDPRSLTIAGHHIHHLFVGLALVVIAGIPVVAGGWRRPSFVAIFGAGLGLTLDELVLLVVRERFPETPYSSPVSLLGAATLIVLACGYVLLATAKDSGDE
jgi:hypothetical protein